MNLGDLVHSKLIYNQMEGEDNDKIVVRLPEPKKEYSEDNQRQINRALTTIVEQLNSTFLTQLKEDSERLLVVVMANIYKNSK